MNLLWLPNLISICGFLCAAGCGLAFSRADAVTASVFFVFACACDFLDGKAARALSAQSVFGACLDSFLDRYADAVMIIGAAWCAAGRGGAHWFLIGFSAIAAGYAVSYVRARSEGLGISNRAGFWERPERLLVLGVSIPLMRPERALLVLAVLPHATALRRLFVVWVESSGLMSETAIYSIVKREKIRMSLGYLAQMTFWLILGSGITLL